MLTIFTFPRPFQGHFNTIQRNAIKSWTLLAPKCEIILLGGEEGTAEAALEFGCRHIPEIAKNEFGTPLFSDIFAQVKTAARGEILAFVNTDIILLGNFSRVVQRIQELQKNAFLMVGRRWDMNIKEPIQFDEAGWERKLGNRLDKEGRLHKLSGMDYWIFPRKFQFDFPPFTIGRFVSDGWLVCYARLRKIPVIDASDVITIIHQNHDYPQVKKSFYETERKRNIKLAGGLSNICTLRDADWLLARGGLRRPPYPRRIFAKLTLFYPWRLILALKRKLQFRLFLR